MTKKLEPCPFCGGEAWIEDQDEHLFVSCLTDGCETTGPIGFTNEDAIRKWNKRV